jgi:murein tripeptide amidase MpaA
MTTSTVWRSPCCATRAACVLRPGGAPTNVHHRAKPASPSWRDHIISPAESEAIVKQLAAFPEVKAYRAGQSYRGRDVSAAEITLPTPSELVSIAKLTAYKPTIFITGRQHANEVSSTSHVLRLGELLVTDPQYKAMLRKVNVILHPSRIRTAPRWLMICRSLRQTTCSTRGAIARWVPTSAPRWGRRIPC